MNMRGGKRPGSGRKKSTDPKKQVTFYAPTSEIEIVGEPRCKEIAADAVSFEAKRLKP